MSRTLSPEEHRILKIIQTHYGSHNSEHSITWLEGNEASLWIKDRTGTPLLVAQLTNLANWRTDGTIADDSGLRDWLQIESK